MKRQLFRLNIFLFLMIGLWACKQEDPLIRNAKNNVSDFYATLDGMGRNRLFSSTISNDTIYLNINYYYPEDSDNEVSLSKILLRASVPSDSKISPSLDEFWDLTQPRHLTVTSGTGEVNKYVVVAKKEGNTTVTNAVLTFEDGTGTQQNVQAIINSDKINFSVVPGTVVNNATITYTINRHSTGSITNGGGVDLTTPKPFVVSSAGNAKRSYTLQMIEAKRLPKGIREGSARVMFAKRMKADLGIDADNMTGGMAVSDKYIVLNTRGQNSVYLDAMTGQKLGAIDLGAIKGSLKNFYSTSDDAGNIFVCNLVPNDGNTFTVWKMSSITATPQPYIQWNSGATPLGRKLSVIGNVNTNAIITVPLNANGSNSFARWQVVNGVLSSSTPEIISIAGYSWSNNNADVIYTSPTSVTSDYFAIGYSNNKLVKVSGATNTIVSSLDALGSNFIANAVDYIEFNNSKYVAYNHVNTFTWGSADQVFLIDTEGGFSGDPSLSSGATPGLIWAAAKGEYGANGAQGPANGNGTGDVIMRLSDNGYYLYMYFMFTNGYVVGVQFDCVDL